MNATAILSDGNKTGVYMNIDVLIQCLRDTQNGSYSTKDFENEYVCIERVIDSLSRIKSETLNASGVITDTNQQ